MRSYGRLSRAAGAVCAATLMLTTLNAQAFKLKHAENGSGVRWASPNVQFVVDSGLNKVIPGGADAVVNAARVWSGAAGAPTLSVTMAEVGAKPALDGKNSVLFLRDFEPAGNALAVTIVSYEESTGTIVDSDVVINAGHSFAVLDSGARAPSDSPLVSTEGKSEGGRSQVFDLTHVAAHEVGHALGLADEATHAEALMYPYTKAGDASVRTPGGDDLDGIDHAYAGANLGSGSARGCGSGASVAGKRTVSDPWAAAWLLIAAAGWLASRRRLWGLAPFGVALVTLVMAPGPAQSAGRLDLVDATARVVAATTRNANGVFQTTLELAPRTCPARACPARLVAHVWGGTLGGITQRVGEEPAATVDDEVDVTFDGPSLDTNIAVRGVVVRAVRHSREQLP